MADEQEIEDASDEADNELYLPDGEVWFRDVYALCDKYGALGFAQHEGVIVALIPGRGVVSIADLLAPNHDPVKLHAVP